MVESLANPALISHKFTDDKIKKIPPKRHIIELPITRILVIINLFLNSGSDIFFPSNYCNTFHHFQKMLIRAIYIPVPRGRINIKSIPATRIRMNKLDPLFLREYSPTPHIITPPQPIRIYARGIRKRQRGL
jgi:hypothetical protein